MKHIRNKVFTLMITAFIAASLISSVTVDSYAAKPVKIRYVAHRGLSERAPENSLASLRLAANNSKVYGVEFDIWESKTEKRPRVTAKKNRSLKARQLRAARRWKPLLIVMHDEDMLRMCGRRTRVTSINRASLAGYTIINGNNVSLYKRQYVPTLKQALDTIYAGSAHAVPVIELKEHLSPEALKYLYDCVGDRRVWISSFDYRAVSDAAAMAKKRGISRNVIIDYTTDRVSPGLYRTLANSMKNKGINCISMRYTSADAYTVRYFHKRRIKVCVWTVPDKTTALRCSRIGVDYITANDVY